ncbi:glycosyl transferase family group 2-domain-containing protein [Phlyctochytrium arcticum]|nr:glycosyl transferase family group 2-domain-containing protein [Phlyctochytrium arcticum]
MSRKAGSPRKKVIPDDLPASVFEVPVQKEDEKDVRISEVISDYVPTRGETVSRYSQESSLATLTDHNLVIDVAPSPQKGKISDITLAEDKGAFQPGQLNKGRTKLVMTMLSYAWIAHIIVILGGTYIMSFQIPQGYVWDQYWNKGCYWKMGWLLPIPYTLVCFLGLALPLRNAKAIPKGVEPRQINNLYILTVTKGDNKEAVMRSWNAHNHLEKLDPCVRVHVLTDEPNHFDNINCYTCPKAFTTQNSKYKARALEWYRKTMGYTEFDWILHLDEESVIDDESVKRVLNFIRYEKEFTWGQGVIMYNQYHFWKNPVFTVADGLRVGDDLSRFHLQYSYFRRPIFGAHGSFLLTNGAVENAVTWDLGSLTEDFQFAVKAWQLGYKCGSVAGIVREQSPLDLIGFLKQRRRWFVGIRRLPSFLPKLLAFFWALGLISLYCTIASIVLGFYVPTDTPLWFGVLKDFSFIVFVYLYVLGMFVENLDRGYNPIILILLIPVTILFQFVAVLLEAIAVMYAIVSPPNDFDVIKK